MFKKMILVSVFSFLYLVSAFSSEVQNFHSQKSNVSFSMGNEYNFRTAELFSNKGENGFNTFVKKIAPYEKTFFNVALGTTVGFGSLLVLGTIFSVAGYAMTIDFTTPANYWPGVYLGYAGSAFIGISWLFFVAAAVNWTFWGMIQYAKKNGVVVAAFAEHNAIGVSFKF